MDRPMSVLLVSPRNTATFHASRWDGANPDLDIEWMAAQFGWSVYYGGTDEKPRLTLSGRNGKRSRVVPGQWVVALGLNGSLRVCSDKAFNKDYEVKA